MKQRVYKTPVGSTYHMATTYADSAHQKFHNRHLTMSIVRKPKYLVFNPQAIEDNIGSNNSVRTNQVTEWTGNRDQSDKLSQLSFFQFAVLYEWIMNVTRYAQTNCHDFPSFNLLYHMSELWMSQGMLVSTSASVLTSLTIISSTLRQFTTLLRWALLK